MTLNIPPEEMAEYIRGAREREAQRECVLAARWERAWQAAGRAAAVLREQFGVTRVVVAGL